MKCGLVGLPNVGKSTIFNLIAQAELAEVGDYAFCTIDPNIAEAEIKDLNIDKLGEAFKSEKIIYPKIKVVDIAGLIKGASEGAGLGNQFLSHIKSVDLLIHVVGIFNTDNEQRSASQAKENIQIINEELILADLSTCMRILDNSKLKAKHTKDQINILDKALNHLNKDMLLYGHNFSEDELNEMEKLGLITSKPMIYAFNLEDGEVVPFDDIKPSVAIYPKNIDIESSNVNKLMELCYRMLRLVTYYTAGPKEARGWKIREGTNAKDAAGAIHSDLSKKFIAAMVQSVDESVANAKPHMFGKDYIVKNGDVCNFKCGK